MTLLARCKDSPAISVLSVGATQGDDVAILEGVKAGEQVVTSGQLKLHPDAAIKIDNTRPLTPSAERPKQ